MMYFMVGILIFIFMVIVVNIIFIFDVGEVNFFRIWFFIVVVCGVWYCVNSLFLGKVLFLKG